MMNKVMTANGITGARADLIDDAHQICAKIRAGENSVALTSWVMSENWVLGVRASVIAPSVEARD